jgi:hypothetical protein
MMAVMRVPVRVGADPVGSDDDDDGDASGGDGGIAADMPQVKVGGDGDGGNGR